MKSFIAILFFIAVFALSGAAMHYFMFHKPGLFIWSMDRGAIVQTKLKVAGSATLAGTVAPQAPAPKVKTPEPATAAEPAPAPASESAKAAAENQPAAPAPAAAPKEEPKVIPLFNGKDLTNWKITQYGGEGEVSVTEMGEMEFGFGAILSGVNWAGQPPRKSGFEISLEAMKLDGTDFFCALTFPVKESHATFVVGGWGGGIVGISSIDDLDASENETMRIEGFRDNVWYKIKVRVTDGKIEAWIDDTQMVDLELKDKKISLRPGDIELSVPIGLASYQTRAKFRNIVWNNLD